MSCNNIQSSNRKKNHSKFNLENTYIGINTITLEKKYHVFFLLKTIVHIKEKFQKKFNSISQCCLKKIGGKKSLLINDKRILYIIYKYLFK